MAKRKSKAVKKCRRILRLSKTRADRGRLWSTGVAPSVGFGAEVFGINGSELMSLRKQAGRVALPGGGEEPVGRVPMPQTNGHGPYVDDWNRPRHYLE